MAKASVMIGRALILIGVTCFFNTGYSMIRCKCVFSTFLILLALLEIGDSRSKRA